MGDEAKLIFALVGKSGCGKDSLARSFATPIEDLEIGIATTSREKRSGEIDGEDYFFIHPLDFEIKVASDEFWEYEYFEKYIGDELVRVGYGLEKEKNRFNDKKYVVTVDYARYKKLKELFGDRVVGIYIHCPDYIRQQRAEDRDANFSLKEWNRRLEHEIQVYDDNLGEFDYTIANVNFSQALAALTEVYSWY